MLKHVLIAALALGTLAACQPRTPVVATTAVAPEPVFKGKYGAN